VLEAIRNSISIASMLGTLGGSIVFKRDDEMERAEASSAIEAEKIAFGE
jgi:small ligand-binding sensory domain FIST